jgi:hypothetical protein
LRRKKPRSNSGDLLDSNRFVAVMSRTGSVSFALLSALTMPQRFELFGVIDRAT